MLSGQCIRTSCHRSATSLPRRPLNVLSPHRTRTRQQGKPSHFTTRSFRYLQPTAHPSRCLRIPPLVQPTTFARRTCLPRFHTCSTLWYYRCFLVAIAMGYHTGVHEYLRALLQNSGAIQRCICTRARRYCFRKNWHDTNAHPRCTNKCLRPPEIAKYKCALWGSNPGPAD